MRIRTVIFILILSTFLTYFSSLSNQFVWDDEQFLYANTYVKEFAIQEIFTQNTVAGAGVISNYYRPFTSLSLSLDYQIWGMNPVGYHLTNTFLHSTVGILLFFLLLQLGLPRFAAFAVSSIFLLHPVQTEAVSYINSRGDSLYALFGLICCNFYVLLLRKKIYSITFLNSTFKLSSTWLTILVPLSYVASILSKEIGIAIGAILLLLTFSEVYQNTATKDLFTVLTNIRAAIVSLFFAGSLGVLYLILRAGPLNFENSYNFYNDGSLYSESIFVRLLSFTKILFIYAKILLWPHPLHMERYSEVITSLASPWPWALLGVLLVIVGLGWYELKKYKTHWIGFGLIWFIALLLPTSGIIAINGMLYEHWLYLPMIGFFVMLGRVVTLLPGTRKVIYATQLPVIIFLLILYCILTIRQNYYWSTPTRFYEHLLTYTDSARIHNNLGMAYAEEGKLLHAITQYQKAISYEINYPQIHYNLGNALLETGNTAQAEEEYLRSIAIDGSFYQSYYKLISLYDQNQRTEEKLALILKAQTAFPTASDFLLLEVEARRPLSASASAQIRQKARERFSQNLQFQRQLDTLLAQ